MATSPTIRLTSLAHDGGAAASWRRRCCSNCWPTSRRRRPSRNCSWALKPATRQTGNPFWLRHEIGRRLRQGRVWKPPVSLEAIWRCGDPGSTDWSPVATLYRMTAFPRQAMRKGGFSNADRIAQIALIAAVLAVTASHASDGQPGAQAGSAMPRYSMHPIALDNGRSIAWIVDQWSGRVRACGIMYGGSKPECTPEDH